MINKGLLDRPHGEPLGMDPAVGEQRRECDDDDPDCGRHQPVHRLGGPHEVARLSGVILLH